MPINNDLPDKTFPMIDRTGEVPVTHFREHLNAIDVKLINAPTYKQLLDYIPRFSLATWEDLPIRYYERKEAEECVDKLFNQELLPTAMETIGLTFLVSNIDLIDVTHLIRHRTMSFSAHCTGDRDQRHDDCLVKPSIVNTRYYYEYCRVVDAAKALYSKMMDEKEISVLDARTILPRCLANHYYARVNLKDLIHFLNQRLDRQIQPESDNIIALRMFLEVCKIYPQFKKVIDLNRPDLYYVHTAQKDHSSNMYMPEHRNDVFDHKEQWFWYNKTREEMPNGHVFMNLWNELVEEIEKC